MVTNTKHTKERRPVTVLVGEGEFKMDRERETTVKIEKSLETKGTKRRVVGEGRREFRKCEVAVGRKPALDDQ